MEILKTLPQNGIYQLSSKEINDILEQKEKFLNINSNFLYDDRFTISLNDQLLLMIENKLIDEDFVIDFFDKISDKYKKRILNEIFHLGINKKYKKIIHHISKYLETNKQNFDENYLLILNIRLKNELNKNLDIGYNKLLNNYDKENYNKELLNIIAKLYNINKSIDLLEQLVNNTTSSSIAYSDDNAFCSLFNRCFNTPNENKVVNLIYKYLDKRELDNEWLGLFDLVRYFNANLNIEQLISEKIKQSSSDNEYIPILKNKKEILSKINTNERLKLLREINRRINFSNVLINEHDYYKFQDFNTSLNIELKKTILFGNGEFGSIHYSTFVYKYFKPISNTDLDNIIFIDRFKDKEYKNREFIAIFDSSTAIATKPKFLADWIDKETFFNFINFIIKAKGINKKFLIKDEVFLYYENE